MLGNVWVFVQLIFGPSWPKKQLNQNSNMRFPISSAYDLLRQTKSVDTDLLETGVHVPDQLVPGLVLGLEGDVLHQRHAVRPEEHAHQGLENKA